MNPKAAAVAITLIEQLVEFLLELKANGQLSDEQLDAALANMNADTRSVIQAFLAKAAS